MKLGLLSFCLSAPLVCATPFFATNSKTQIADNNDYTFSIQGNGDWSYSRIHITNFSIDLKYTQSIWFVPPADGHLNCYVTKVNSISGWYEGEWDGKKVSIPEMDKTYSHSWTIAGQTYTEYAGINSNIFCSTNIYLTYSNGTYSFHTNNSPAEFKYTGMGANWTTDVNVINFNADNVSLSPSLPNWLDTVSFDKNKLIVPDYEKSYYESTNDQPIESRSLGYTNRHFAFTFPYFPGDFHQWGWDDQYYYYWFNENGTPSQQSISFDMCYTNQTAFYNFSKISLLNAAQIGISNVQLHMQLDARSGDSFATQNLDLNTTTGDFNYEWKGSSLEETLHIYIHDLFDSIYFEPCVNDSSSILKLTWDPIQTHMWLTGGTQHYDNTINNPAGSFNIPTPETNPAVDIDQTAFNKNKLSLLDHDQSYYDSNTSFMVLKYNDDYVDASLMAWDCNLNQVSGAKSSDGHYDNSNWIKEPDIAQFAKTLPQYALDDLSNAIINGKLIDTGCLTDIFDWTIPNTTNKPMEWYANTESSFSLMNFLISHAHDDQSTLETAISNLPTLKWKTDYDFFAIDIASALQFDNFSDIVTHLLTQNLSYTLTYIDGAADGQHTKTFNLTDLVGGEIDLSFSYPTESATWFQLQSCVTNSGAFGTIGSSDTLGVCDTENLVDGHPKVYSLDGQDSNYFRFQPPKFVLSHALDKIDGKPHQGADDSDLYFGATGLDTNPAAWDSFTKSLYSHTPSQIKTFIDAGKVPATDSGIGNDVTFTKTCFIKVKDTFTGEFNIDDIVDHVDYTPNDATGHLILTIHFKDESSGDQPQTLDIGLFAKQTNIWKHVRTTPIKIEPSQINQQYIIDNLIKYSSTPTTHADDDDPYLFETNLNKTEFVQALQGITFKVQDDDNGKLDVIFSIRSLVYNVNETGMPTPSLTTFEIIDNDFIPLKPSHGTNLLALWIILGIVGTGGIVATPILIKRRGKKYNTNYDEEAEEELNQRKLEAKKSGKEFIENKSAVSSSTHYTKTEMQDIKAKEKANKKPSKLKSLFKKKQRVEVPKTETTSQEDLAAIGE